MTTAQVIMMIQYLAIALTFGELLYALLQKPSEPQKHIVILGISVIVMFTGYIIEVRSANLKEALIGTAVSYMGKPFVMLSSLLLFCSYYRRKIPNWLVVLLGIYSAGFSILIFTNDLHHLYYQTTDYVKSTAYSPLIITRGPLYYVYMATMIVFFALCLYIIITGYLKVKTKQQKRLSLYSLLMVVCSVSGYMVYLFADTNGYDCTMLGVFISAILLFVIFVRCRVFDTLTVAKDFALDDSKTGLVVIDENNKMLYQNSLMENLFSQDFTYDKLTSSKDNAKVVIGDRIYAIHVKQLYQTDEYLGRAFEVSDVTDYINYQARLEHDVRERTEKLEDMQHEIIASVANIVEARSLETGEHIARTSRYSKLIASGLRDMGKYSDVLTNDYISVLVAAAPLHDIGKISIPDSILLKPGRLTPDEFEIMKTHSMCGAQIVEKTLTGLEEESYVKMAYDIAKHHHERWDGKGYPAGLSGEEIPLSARIVALADCFDAMITKRCYKDAMSTEQAVAIIREEKGTHFDPDVVDAFLTAIEMLEGEEHNR